MKEEFWHQRWQLNEIGFHLDHEHPELLQNFNWLAARGGETVFVPLCGKSLDLIWLAKQGLQVVGVELSPLAIEAFFREQGQQPEKRTEGELTLWQSGAIRIYEGDFFKLQSEQLQGARLVYDRAALIALPPEIRRDYARRITELTPTGGRMLLVTNHYRQHAMQGPPFSVTATDVEGLYGEGCGIERLSSKEMIDEHPGLRQRGLDSFVAETFVLEKK